MDDPTIDYKINLPLLEINLELENIKNQVKESRMPQLFGVGKGGSVLTRALVTEDSIYFGACDGFLYALDLNGKEKWRFQAGDVLASSGIVVENKIYFGSFDSKFYCLDLNGKLIWKFQSESPLGGFHSIYKNSIYIGSKEGALYCISLDGILRWKFEAGDTIGSNIEVNDNGVYFCSYNNKIYCVSHDGKLKWTYTAKDIPECPTIYNSTILFASFDNNIYALSNEGKLLWKMNIGAPVGGQAPGLTVENDIAYFGTWEGDIMAIDLKNKKVTWRYKTGDFVFAKPVVNDGVVYVGSLDTNFYALTGNTGKLIWKIGTSSPNVSTPVYSNGRLYFGTYHGKLICMSAKGHIEWDFQTSMKTPSPVDVQSKLEFKKVIQESETIPEKFQINYLNSTQQKPRDGIETYGALKTLYKNKDAEDYLGRQLNLGSDTLSKRRAYR